ncbi:MAG: hypothetical protein NTY08_02830 [Proteobacteria bacterium]|nr:hypothetical protein [Pseudomonadota bacterium]
MNSRIFISIVLAMISLATIAMLPLPKNASSALVAGVCLFAGNSALLFLIARKIFSTNVSLVGNRRSGIFFLLAIVLKVFGLGIGIYIGLVVWRLPVIYFVSGAVVGLVGLVVAVLIGSAQSEKKVTVVSHAE